MFNDKIEMAKILRSSSIAFVYKMLGGNTRIFIILCILMLVDTIFGWIKGVHNKNWNSKTARWGFSEKIIELIFIGVLYALDWALEVDYLKCFGIGYVSLQAYLKTLQR